MIRKYAEFFCWKNVSSFCSAKATHIFSAKNIRILYIEVSKTVNEMTLNELVKLTMLWTTGPRILHDIQTDMNILHWLYVCKVIHVVIEDNWDTPWEKVPFAYMHTVKSESANKAIQSDHRLYYTYICSSVLNDSVSSQNMPWKEHVDVKADLRLTICICLTSTFSQSVTWLYISC